MSSTQNSRAVPIRLIIMILVSLAILFAALGVHGLVTRNDDPQAALNAQEAKIKEAAKQAPAAAPAPANAPVCLISVAKAPLADANGKLTKAGFKLVEQTETWPAKPAAPKATTVYFPEGGEAEAKSVQAALPGSAVAARPAGLDACDGQLAVAVVKK